MPNDYSMDRQQRDIVLSPNEFVFVQSNTNGIIKTYAGPTTITVSGQDTLVIFDEKSKTFEPVQNAERAKQLFIIPPENWYAVLKNPAVDNKHPDVGSGTISPKLSYGRKVNIKGPDSFALFPGQMAKVIRGHALRTNQYLKARVYEAEAASNSKGEMLDAEGKPIKAAKTAYVNGQILIIKGTDVSFYIPPTGIEVIPVNNDPRKGYVRDAVTLERLEYCILKDEDGNKRYVHGPEVVFPEPTETFVSTPKGGYVFRAIELSPISGIYVKVIAEYKDEDGLIHPVGEEMFITGNEQMIYYPRPEHAIISYDNKIMHHAIAIPEGEGRYVMNRLTGEIETVLGPKMFLPDPRTQVVVKRKLTARQCDLWYPGNYDVKAYNESLSEKAVEKKSKSFDAVNAVFDSLGNTYSLSNSITMNDIESNANIARGTSYTKPRTVMLDTKFEGVVALDVWTGYAVNVISKNGDRKVICGPQTVLLDYDQTLEVLTMSTGKPKTTDYLIQDVFLRYEHNKVSDLITVETKDFVTAQVKVSYSVNFDPAAIDKWFSVENYVKTLCDRERSLIKREAKQYTIDEFYQNYADIVRNIAINFCGVEEANNRRYFDENGMYVYDCEVLSIDVQSDIENLLVQHQHEMVQKALELSDAERRITVAEALAVAQKRELELRTEQQMNEIAQWEKKNAAEREAKSKIARMSEAERAAAQKAEQDLQPILDAIRDAEIAREKREDDARIEYQKQEAELKKQQQAAYADTVAKIMASIGPDLVAAMNNKSNADLMETVAKAMSPYAMARGESVAEVTDKLVRGLTVDEFLKGITTTKDND